MSEKDIKNNVETNRKAIDSSKYKKSGLTAEKTELSSKNFDKLMKQRGLSKEDTESIKKSFDRTEKMQVRHAKAGEKYIVTHGEKNASGVFVSEKSLGKTADQRKDKGALPHSNSAKYETKVVLDKHQNVVSGKIASQSKFQKMDPKQTPRNGGGTQVITDGGYKNGAIRQNDTKYPVPADSKELTPSQKFRASLESKKSEDTKNSNVNSNSRTNSNKRGR